MTIRPLSILLALGPLAAFVSLSAQQPKSQTPSQAKSQTKGKYIAPDPGAFPLGETQGGGGRVPAAPKVAPAPHLANGLPDFGGDGAWYPGFSGNIAEEKWKGVHSADKHVDVPFRDWSLKIFNERVETVAKDDPEAQCLPVGIPRYMFDPYPFQMIQTASQVVFIFEGDNYPWRIIRIDPKLAHPKGIKPSWMGDATGRYEGDTLVSDVIAFNDKSWLDQAGHTHSDKMHLTERYTRTDSHTLKYEVTIDDPEAYTKPWTTSNTVRWRPSFKLMEYVCEENEKDARHMTAPANSK